MVVALSASYLPAMTSLVRLPVLRWAAASLHTSCSLDAARKGTRARREAKKKAAKKEKVIKEVEFIPLKKRLEMQQTGGVSPRRNEANLKTPTDDVWITKFYKWKIYSVEEALNMHRETHHPTQIGIADSLVEAFIELDMSTEKKNRFLDNFGNVVKMAHDFDLNHEKAKSVLVISRSEEVQHQALQMGAAHAMGPEIVKQVQGGDLDVKTFDHVVADLAILPDIISIRGLLRKQFPSVKNGTAGSNVLKLMDRFLKGVEYSTTKDKFHHDYAVIKAPIGPLTLSNQQLEENLAAILEDIEKQKSQKKSGDLITLTMLLCPPSKERFKVDHTLYLPQQHVEPVKVAATAEA